MPNYSYHCDKCESDDERFVELDDFDRLAYKQRCKACESIMRKVITAPVLKLDSNIMSGMDDGFGPDDFSRKIAKEQAEAAGVVTSGAKFHPGLCREGHFLDPQAWYHSPEEVKKKAAALGRNVSGSITHTSVPKDEKYIEADKPYRVAPDMVMADACRIVNQEHGGRVSRKKAVEIVETLRDTHSGIAKPAGV